jgi:hypothetical protein
MIETKSNYNTDTPIDEKGQPKKNWWEGYPE